jgi:hypothetical protein
MGSRTQLLGLFLAMMTLNVIYMQGQQSLNTPDSSPSPEEVTPAPSPDNAVSPAPSFSPTVSPATGSR